MLPRNSAAYLQLFDEEASSLAAEDAVFARQELQRHLDAAIKARLELGANLAEAEAQAIDSLGSPKKIVAGVKAANARHFEPSFCRSLALMLLFMSCTLQLQIHWIIAVPLLVLVTVFFFSALRARTFQLKALLVAYPLFSLWAAVGSLAGFISSTVPETQPNLVLPWMIVITIMSASASVLAHARIHARARRAKTA